MQVDAGSARPLDEVADLTRRGDPDRVREDDLGGVQLLAERGDDARIDAALEGAAEGDADAHGRGALGGVEDRLRLLERLVERHVAVPPVEGLRRGEVEVDPVERGLAQALVAPGVEDEARVFGAVAPLGPRHNLLGPAIRGTRSSRTKLTASMRGSPVAASRLTSSARSAGASVSGSFWRPSRGPTSQIVTTAGTICCARWPG